jgi:hypothetical protein
MHQRETHSSDRNCRRCEAVDMSELKTEVAARAPFSLKRALVISPAELPNSDGLVYFAGKLRKLVSIEDALRGWFNP